MGLELTPEKPVSEPGRLPEKTLVSIITSCRVNETYLSRKHDLGAAGESVDTPEVEPGGEDDRSGGWELVQVAQQFHLSLAVGQGVSLAGWIFVFCALGGSVGVQGLVAVGGSVPLFIDIADDF